MNKKIIFMLSILLLVMVTNFTIKHDFDNHIINEKNYLMQ